jgi:hypothetical protein
MNAKAKAARSIDEPLSDGHENNSRASQSATGGCSPSQRNIAEWESYLPHECVVAMIAMGWDETT